jgi:streptogramin lyase
VRVDPTTGATTVITEGGNILNALGLAFDSHPHVAVVTDGGKLLHVVPASGAQTVIVSDGRLYQDVAVRPDGKFAAINLPSAGPSGVFLIEHDGTTTKFNTGTHFGDGPTGIVIGKDGHFYVSHLGTPMVIRVDKNSGAETVVAQGGKLQSPSGIALSKDGHLLVSDFGTDAVIHVNPANGHQSIVTQGGHLKSPFDIAVEPNGNIVVVDLVGDKLIRIDHATHVQTVLAQGGLLEGIRSVEVFGGG